MHTKVYHDKVYRLLSKGKGERKKTIAILKYIRELLLAATNKFLRSDINVKTIFV